MCNVHSHHKSTYNCPYRHAYCRHSVINIKPHTYTNIHRHRSNCTSCPDYYAFTCFHDNHSHMIHHVTYEQTYYMYTCTHVYNASLGDYTSRHYLRDFIAGMGLGRNPRRLSADWVSVLGSWNGGDTQFFKSARWSLIWNVGLWMSWECSTRQTHIIVVCLVLYCEQPLK